MKLSIRDFFKKTFEEKKLRKNYLKSCISRMKFDDDGFTLI